MPLTALPDRPPDTLLSGPLAGAASELVGARPGDVVVVRAGLVDVATLLARRVPSGPGGVVSLPGTPWWPPPAAPSVWPRPSPGPCSGWQDELGRSRYDLLAVPGAHPLTGDVCRSPSSPTSPTRTARE